MIALLLCLVILASIIYLTVQKPKGYPPGPIFLPIIGSLYAISATTVYKSQEKWRKQYGNIVGHKVGNYLVVFVRGFDELKNGLKHPYFQDRSKSIQFTQRTMYKPLGFFFNSNNEHVMETRKIVLKYLGINCNVRLNTIVADEMQHFFTSLQTDTPIEINNESITVPFKVILRYLIGVEDDRTKLNKIRKYISTGFRSGRTTGIEVYYPFLRYIVNYSPIKNYTKRLHSFIKELLKAHRKTLDMDNARDLVDLFLIEQTKNPEIFSDEQIIACFVELIEAGNESVTNTSGFIFLYLALNPDVQEKLRKELHSVVGFDKTPTLEDRPKLPYLEAVIAETMRANIIVPLTVARKATEDTTFYNYNIPKGTEMVFSLWSVMYDDTVWEKPDEYIPDRFIKGDQFVKPESFIPFSIGKRNCVLEIFAKNMLFLHTAMFFQKYSIHLVPGQRPPTTDALTGFTNAPKPFDAIFKRISSPL